MLFLRFLVLATIPFNNCLIIPIPAQRYKLITNTHHFNLNAKPPTEDNKSPEEDRKFPDPVEKYAEFVGFKKDEKWKAVRYTVYYYAGFSILGELYNKYIEYSNNPFN